MTRLLLVCAGGAIGSGARYLLTAWLTRVAGTWLPWGTLAVNITGCFLLALLMQSGAASSDHTRLAIATGALGGFTTYSAFNYDATTYLAQGAWAKGAAYVFMTLAACFVGGLAGAIAGRALRGA